MKDYRWEDLQVGLREQFEVGLCEEMMATFLRLSQDSNPLHHDLSFAHACGHPSPVAFGLLTSAFYSRLVGVHLPGKYALLQGIDIDFVSPAYVGDLLCVSGEVRFLSEAVRRVELKAEIRTSQGRQVSRARIRVGLHHGA